MENVLREVYSAIEDRKARRPAGSYVAGLMDKGLPAIIAKVEEEATELVVAARTEPNQNLIHEAADLVFHTFVLLAYRNIRFEDLCAEFQKRRR
jgi:phosphoribosyl-ATP pyrophosphohydrolase